MAETLICSSSPCCNYSTVVFKRYIAKSHDPTSFRCYFKNLILISMKKKSTYKEIEEADYVMKMMEDVFGHTITSWSPQDTARLKDKLYQPISDKEKEDYVAVVEPLMNQKSLIPKNKDRYLDAFLDLDTRVSQKDFLPQYDPDAEELDNMLGVDLT